MLKGTHQQAIKLQFLGVETVANIFRCRLCILSMLQYLYEFIVTYKAESSISRSFKLKKLHECFVYNLKLLLNLLKHIYISFFIIIVTYFFKRNHLGYLSNKLLDYRICRSKLKKYITLVLYRWTICYHRQQFNPLLLDSLPTIEKILKVDAHLRI